MDLSFSPPDAKGDGYPRESPHGKKTAPLSSKSGIWVKVLGVLWSFGSWSWSLWGRGGGYPKNSAKLPAPGKCVHSRQNAQKVKAVHTCSH